MIEVSRARLSIAVGVALLGSVAAEGAACEGDCNFDGAVQVDEIVLIATAALTSREVGCVPAPQSRSIPTVETIQRATSNALEGCLPPAPTPTLALPQSERELVIRESLRSTGVKGIALSPDGSHLYVAAGCRTAATCSFGHDGPGSIDVFARDVSGGLQLLQTLSDGIDAVDGISNLVSIALTADGEYLYAAGYGDGSIAAFRRDVLAGTLTPAGVAPLASESFSPIASPRAISISPDGKHLYLLAYRAIAVFARETLTGRLSLSSVTADDEKTAAFDSLRAIVTTPDGSLVIVGGSEGLTFFRRDPSSGALTFTATHRRLRGVPLEVHSLAWSRGGWDLFVGLPGGLAVVRASGEPVLVDFELVGQPSYAASPAVRASSAAGDDTVLAVAGDVLTKLARNGVTGVLDVRGSRQSYDFVGSAGIATSADGRFAYVGGTLGIVIVELQRSS